MSSITVANEYEAAIHLNNVGVALLERGWYQQALETMADAVSVMIQSTSTATVSPSALARTDKGRSCPTWGMLQRADLWLAQSPDLFSPQSIHFDVNVYSNWDQPVVQALVAQDMNRTAVGAVIRIDLIKLCAALRSTSNPETACRLNELADSRIAEVYMALEIVSKMPLNEWKLSELENLVGLVAVLQEDVCLRFVDANSGGASIRYAYLSDIRLQLETTISVKVVNKSAAAAA